MTNNFTNALRKNSAAKKLYYSLVHFKNIVRSLVTKLYIFIYQPTEHRLLKKLGQEITKIHPTNGLNLTTDHQKHTGKNILGFPALSFIKKDDELIGWSHGALVRNDLSLPFLQVTTDSVKNIPLLFETFKPEIVVDFGTASGGSAIFYYELLQKYCDPKILTIDISSNDVDVSKEFHDAYRSKEKIRFLAGESGLLRFDEVKEFLSTRKDGQRVLLSFDDDHSYMHTYRELKTFAPLLQSGDIILMQDTWDQGLYYHEKSPMLAVERFLEENSGFELAKTFLSQVELPCNFIYGVLIKK